MNFDGRQNGGIKIKQIWRYSSDADVLVWS